MKCAIKLVFLLLLSTSFGFSQIANETTIVDYFELQNRLKGNINTGTIEVEDVLKARQEVAGNTINQKRTSIDLNWEEVGPNNVGGRVRALVIDKFDHEILYSGGVSGGMYISTNGGNNWERMAGFDEIVISTGTSPSISTIAQASDGTLYVGTGCSFETASGNADSGMIGSGIFKSTNGGISWVRLENASPQQGNSSNAPWVFVNRLAINQQNGSVYAAMNKGLYRSTDKGENWVNVISAVKDDCTDPVVAMGQDVKVTSDGTIVAVIGGELYRSATGNACSFEKISSVKGDRVSIAYSKADENYFYAIAEVGGELKAIYKSTDKAQTWEVLQNPIDGYFDEQSGLFNGQGNYDLAIGANPFNKEDIIIGGVQIWRHNGNLTRIAAEFLTQNITIDNIIGKDKHDIIFDEKEENIIYVLTDEGIYKSITDGKTWFPINKGLNIAQFYSVAYDADGKLMGGTQMTGTIEITGNNPNPMTGIEVLGGDGFECDYSQITDIRFASIYSENVLRGVDGSGFGSICGSNGPDCGWGSFYTKIRLWETLNDPSSPKTVAFNNVNGSVGMEFSNGKDSIFSGILRHKFWGGQFVKNEITFNIGTFGSNFYLEVNDSSVSSNIGVFTGDGTGTIDYNSGQFEIIFNKIPQVNKILFAGFNSLYPIGTEIQVYSNSSTPTIKIPIKYTLTANLNPNETVLIPDPVQSLLAVNSGSGISITRDALDLTKQPEWWKVGGITGTASCIEFSQDGNHIFVGTWSGSLYRVSNLNKIYSSDDLARIGSVTKVGTFNQVITGVAVDPNNANNVVLTLGGYGGTNYIYRSTSATLDSVIFDNITGDLPKMPCYDAIIDINDSNRVFIGTEHGVWATENIYGPSVNWVGVSNSLGNVPVFEIRQQINDFTISHNKGEIYLATHGRGLWKSSSLVGINDFKANIEEKSRNNLLHIYPNPMMREGYIEFYSSDNSNGIINIFDIRGKLIQKSDRLTVIKGNNTLPLVLKNIEAGTYFVVLQLGSENKVGKILINN